MSIRYYRRLLQMGVNNTEVWNNLGLCCFYSAQYDMALGCFDRALSLADDEAMADVWYVHLVELFSQP
jgi:tetratricopeptide repeat protein 8